MDCMINMYILNILRDRKTLFIATILACLVIYYINPFDNVMLESWDRSFSLSVINSISITKRISNLYNYILITIPIVFGICLSISTFIISKNEKLKNSLNDICFISLFAIVIAFFSRFVSDSEVIVKYSVIISTLISFFSSIIIAAVLRITEKFEYDDYILVFINHLFITVALALPFNISSNDNYLYICAGIITLIESFFYKLIICKGKRDIFFGQCSLAYYSIAIWVITIEVLYLVTLHGVIINHPARLILRVIVIYIGISFFFGSILKSQIGKEVNFTGIIISLASLMLMGNQYKLYYDIIDYANLYEVGNVSILFETIERTKLPIIDYFSAHALHDILSRIIYWIVSGDPYSAVFANPWNGLINGISIVSFYFILKEILNKKWAILSVLLYPFMIKYVLWGQLSFIAVLGVIYIIKGPKNFIRYIIFWITFLICVFSRYDTGISVGIGCLLSGIILATLNKISFKYSLTSAICIFIPLFALYVIYCNFVGIDWISRIKEWLSVSVGSTSTWATASFGDVSSIKFFFVYELFPIVDAFLLIITLLTLLRNKTYILHGTLSLIFSCAYAFMISRTLIWHNLSVEPTGGTGILLNYFHLAIFFFTLYMCKIHEERLTKSQQLIIPFVTLSIVMFIASNIVGNSVINESSFLFGRGYNIASNFSVKNMGIVGNSGKSRIEFSDNTETLVNSFIKLFNGILEDDQTFIDFANVTGLYALTGRENPAYVSQTPSLLTDDYSQECYLKDIKCADAPLAIIGKSENEYIMSMAGARHNIRYYKIAEYIYNNYRPFVSIGQDFAIWCKNDKYNEYLTTFENLRLDTNTYKLISPGYDAELHKYNIGDVPFLWANADKYNAVDNDVICTATRVSENDVNGLYQAQFDFSLPGNLDKSDGHYIYFECTNNSDTILNVELTLSYKYKTDEYSMSFNIKPGENRYMFRVSSDYYWYYSNISSAVFECDSDTIKIDNVKILEGD